MDNKICNKEHSMVYNTAHSTVYNMESNTVHNMVNNKVCSKEHSVGDSMDYNNVVDSSREMDNSAGTTGRTATWWAAGPAAWTTAARRAA